MPTPQISVETRRALREYLVHFSVIRNIREEFEAAGIECDETHQPDIRSKRRLLVEQYFATLDFADLGDVKRFLRVFESVLFEAEYKLEDPHLTEQEAERLESMTDKMVELLERDGYTYEDGVIRNLSGVAGLAKVAKHAAQFDAEYMQRHIARIEDAVDSDPAQAIGQAKELVETCCKTIMREQGEPAEGNPNFHELLRSSQAKLNLLPENIPHDANAFETIKRLLSNLAELSRAMAELRNWYGTGHGKDGRWRGLAPRHARLAVGAAVSLTNFLFETHTHRVDAASSEPPQEVDDTVAKQET